MHAYWKSDLGEGEFLGEFQILGILGKGSWGTSYHVIGNENSKEFVLKTLALHDNLSLEWIERLEAQTIILTKLNHLNIDKILRFGRFENLWYGIKDFIHDGIGSSCNLKQFMNKQATALSPPIALGISFQILQGLDYLHSYQDDFHSKLCHGNLKPQNILIENGKDSSHTTSFYDGQIRLTDAQPYGLMASTLLIDNFGEWVSKMLTYNDYLHEKTVQKVLNNLYLSFNYRNPEKQLHNKEETPPSIEDDFYAWSTITYEMLTRSLPFGHTIDLQNLGVPTDIANFIMLPLYAQGNILLDTAKVKSSFHSYLEKVTAKTCEEVRKTIDKKPIKKARRSLTPPGMIYIPPGTAYIGSNDCGEDAAPEHEFSIEGFYLDRCCVSIQKFKRFIAETGYITEAERDGRAPLWKEGEWKVTEGVCWKNPLDRNLPQDFDNHPVTQVTYADVEAYCQWLDRRLPSEKEWEYAARGGKRGNKFPWGNQLDPSKAHYSANATCCVHSYPPNEFNLYDMSGNVWEWTHSWYQAYPNNDKPSKHYGEKYRVVRGGAWFYDAMHCMVAFRNANDPLVCYPTLGFRTAYDFKTIN